MKHLAVSLGDVLADAWAGINSRPSRTLLAGLGCLLGVSVFLVTQGVAETASAQVSDTFTELVATEVRLEDKGAGGLYTAPDDSIQVGEIEQRLSDLAGLRYAGVRWSLESEPPLKIGLDPTADSDERLPLLAVTPGYFRAVRATMESGRAFDAGHDQREEDVAVLGASAARRLGVGAGGREATVWIGGRRFPVAGIVADVQRDPDVLGAVLIPAQTAIKDFSLGIQSLTVLIDVSPGAAEQVAGLAPLAIRPQDPGRFQVSYPPEPKRLRRAVEAELDSLLLGLSFVVLAVGAIGIANTNFVSVMERKTEIGLRRAIGSAKVRIAGQFVIESILIGLGSGVVAAALSPAVIILIATLQGWSPVLETKLLVVGPLIGGLVGAISGAWPAWRAARIEPASALRR